MELILLSATAVFALLAAELADWIAAATRSARGPPALEPALPEPALPVSAHGRQDPDREYDQAA